MESLKSIIKAYEAWVSKNPETASDMEATTKALSYFIAGRISNSNVVSELTYALSNMLVLYNDRIIYKAIGGSKTESGGHAVINEGGFCDRLKIVLTTLEYSEVFIEISAKRLFGKRGKWFFVIVLQLFKAAGRFFILKYSTEQIITSPAINFLNRRDLVLQHKEAVSAGIGGAVPKVLHSKTQLEENRFTFHLKRSGRVVRKVEGAPPLAFRDFETLVSGGGAKDNATKNNIPQVLLQAECLYIAKPLIHLAAMGIFGEKRWKQYVVAIVLDLMSIRMYYNNRHLMNKHQKLEMSRRCTNLLMYMMRSPFYERYTKNRLERALGFVGLYVPLAHMFTEPLKDYLTHWQNTYFYLWST